ncbi:hypothetical protein AUJ17_05365 [Candidatus Micrarchaeota archaeon CG1_02_47_40]|nr:MAG: hypothetical protein AUJ17_05365 [Candidatus Micrarchaeota archaeon CG1_02_47_40]
MRTFSSFIFDLDGVLYLGSTPIRGAAEALCELGRRNCRIFFLTNNATKTRGQYRKKLAAMGIDAKKKHIYTSAYGTAKYLVQEKIRKVFVVGEAGLKREIRGAGVRICTGEEADAVVVGLDRKFDYKKLAHAASAIRNGALFIATNTDATLPLENGFAPGAGAMVEAAATASGKRPEVIIGKPQTFLIEDILDENDFQKREVAFVGDRLDTDMLASNKLGIFSFCVLTGSTDKHSASRARGLYKPGKIIKSVEEVLKYAKEATD